MSIINNDTNRGAFYTLPNIYDRAFLQKTVKYLWCFAEFGNICAI